MFVCQQHEWSRLLKATACSAALPSVARNAVVLNSLPYSEQVLTEMSVTWELIPITHSTVVVFWKGFKEGTTRESLKMIFVKQSM